MTTGDAAQVRASMALGDRRQMPGMVRISFGMYNTIDEVDVLVDALGKIARGDYQGKYVQDHASGEFLASGWSPNLAEYFKLHAYVPQSIRHSVDDLRPPRNRPMAQ